MKDLACGQVSAAQAQALLQEIVRDGVARMVEALEVTPEETQEERLIRLEQDQSILKTALRNRNWEPATRVAAGAADAVGLGQGALTEPGLARRILMTGLRLVELETRVEETLDDPIRLGKDLLQDHGLTPSRDGLRPPMRLSEAIQKAREEATDEVAKKIDSVGRFALDFFGDIVMTELTFDASVGFLEFVWWMPKNWGKGHGKNRYRAEAVVRSPRQERAAADQTDAKVVEAVLADASLTRPDKRIRLIANLTPRLTDGYTVVLRDIFRRVIVAGLGAQKVGRDMNDEDRILPSHNQLKKLMAKWKRQARTPCGLPTRVSKPKVRRSWSLERIGKLLSSPIYRGSTPKLRSRPGKGPRAVIRRDALYWVPLIMLTMGARPEEILQLMVSNVIFRNRVFCLVIEGELKTDQSQRILPIPQLLLDLGFIDWVRVQHRKGAVWLFPEIPEDKSNGRRSQIFGDRMRSILKTLGLASEHEDIYALRRTLSSRLLHARVDTGVRQRILGHLEGTTVDAHYSDDGLAELKDYLDMVDYGIEIAQRSSFAFPVIAECHTSLLPQALVEVDLQGNGEVGAIGVYDAATEEVLLEARIAGAKLPPSSPRSSATALEKEDCASRLLAMSASHEVLMPGSEEATRAIEHLLVFANSTRSPAVETPFA